MIRILNNHRYLSSGKLLYTSTLITYFALLLLAGFVFPHFLPGEYIFGFRQLEHLGWGYIFISFCIILLFVFIYRRFAYQINILIRNIQNILYSKKRYTILIAVLCCAVFLLFKNNFINQDGCAFTAKFHRDVLTKGAHVSVDWGAIGNRVVIFNRA